MTADPAFNTPQYDATSAALAAAEAPNPLCFNPDGTFKSLEMAAFHAIHVQGGFTTPAREARRMIDEAARTQTPAAAAQATMAAAWLAERGLSVDGQDEPPEQHTDVEIRIDGNLKAQSIQITQQPVTPAEAATAQILDDLPARPVTVDLDQLADPAPLAWYQAINDWDRELADLDDQAKAIAEKRDRAIETIQAAMGDATEARVNGRPVITWKVSKPTQRLDRKALEADYGPGFVARYLVDNKAARPFRILPRRGAR